MRMREPNSDKPAAASGRKTSSRPPTQDGIAVGVLAQELEGGRQRDQRTVVTAHAIYREGDRH